MNYKKLDQQNLDLVVKNYIDYYNQHEESCWTYEKAYKRIHQVMTMEDAMCLVQYKDDEPVGFLMGYYKEYDDLTAYCLEEIVIFSRYQNQGYGTQFIQKLEEIITAHGANHLELLSVNDEHHMHFYGKLGFYLGNNLTLMAKHYE